MRRKTIRGHGTNGHFRPCSEKCTGVHNLIRITAAAENMCMNSLYSEQELSEIGSF